MELWDLYDSQRNPLNKTHERGQPFAEGEFYVCAEIWVKNSEGKFLITKRHPDKKAGNLWEFSGGGTLAGETTKQSAVRELEEETGIKIDESELELFATYQKKNPNGHWDEFGAWYAKADDYASQPARDTIYLQNPYAENFCDTYDLRKYKVGNNATIFSPQGGLRISFEELTHAAKMILNRGIYHGRKILTEKSLAEMFKPQWIFDGQNGATCGGVMLNYGLGEYKIDGKTSARLVKNREINFVGHTGIAFGIISGMFFDENFKDAIIYVANGHCIDEDDPRAKGKFSGNYIWEENIFEKIFS